MHPSISVKLFALHGRICQFKNVPIPKINYNLDYIIVKAILAKRRRKMFLKQFLHVV